MKNKIILVSFGLILLTGCYTQYDVITDAGGTPGESEYLWLWNSYYNLKENSTQKRENKETGKDQSVGSYAVGKNAQSYYKIIYKQNYFHNLIAVFSFGIFVPMQVELCPHDNRPLQNTEEAAE